MPSKFDRVFPSKGRIEMDGGLNNKFDKQLIANNESPDTLNCVFGNDSVETRGGSDLLNTAAVGSFVGDGLYTRHDNDGSQSMCGWWDGTLFVFDGTSFISVTSSKSIFTAGVRVAGAEYEDHIFFGNGGTLPYKWNGAEFTRHGIYPPTTAATAATNSTGVLSGDYRYKFTYVNSALVESDVGTSSDTFTAANESMDITVTTANASFGVNQRHIYRNVTSGAVFFRVGTIANNTDTVFVDNFADASLGVTAPADQGVPPVYSHIVYHKDRLFVNDPDNRNFVWYSELTNPYVFKATNFLRAGDNTADLVEGLAIYNNSLAALCDNNIWITYMPTTTASDWIVVKAKTPFGSKSPFGTFLFNDKLMFPAVQNNKIVGFAALAGLANDPSATILTISAIGSDLKSNPVEPDIFKIVEGQMHNISSYVFKNKAYTSVTYGSGNSTNNRIFVWDFSLGDLGDTQREGKWSEWTGITATQFTEFDGVLYAQDSTDTGKVYSLNTSTYNDNGSAINSYYWTKEFPGLNGDENWFKDYRKVELLYQKSGDYFMDFTYKVDSDKGVGTTQQIDLNPGGSLWGTMVWGRDSWGGGQDEGEQNFFLGQVRGKRFQMKFSNQNTLNQKFKITGAKITYNLVGRR